MNLINFNNRLRNNASHYSNVFDTLFNEAFLKHNNIEKSPRVNLSEDASSFTIEIAAPGLKKEDFNIQVKKDSLSVWVEEVKEETKSVDNYNYKEFEYRSFSRSFNLPEIANLEQIAASYTDGILKVTINKKDNTKAEVLDIKVQ